jgi:hypothetical protein
MTVPSYDGCRLPFMGAVEALEASAVAFEGLEIPYFAIKLSKGISGGVAGSEGPLPSGFTNSQISLASAWVLTAVSQVSHC